jgi:IS5 family transposase
VIILTPGNIADCKVAPDCVDLIAGIKKLLGDKAYDSDSFRKSLTADGITPVIPGRSNRKRRIRHDKEAYKGRNVIERCYCRLKELQTHRNPLRQTRPKLFLRSVPRGCRCLLGVTQFESGP